MSNEMKISRKEPTLGSDVWVVERDEDGVAQTVTGYVFLTNLLEWVIASPMLSESSDPNVILSNQAATTAEGFSLDLYVFPKKDCFAEKESAIDALFFLKGGIQNADEN